MGATIKSHNNKKFVILTNEIIFDLASEAIDYAVNLNNKDFFIAEIIDIKKYKKYEEFREVVDD